MNVDVEQELEVPLEEGDSASNAGYEAVNDGDEECAAAVVLSARTAPRTSGSYVSVLAACRRLDQEVSSLDCCVLFL